MNVRLRTVLIGFGRIAHKYALDKKVQASFPYSTRAQVLKAHGSFDWNAVVDPDPESRTIAKTLWAIPEVVANVTDLKEPDAYDVAVIATPPTERQELIQSLGGLKGVLVEKPLALTSRDAREFVEEWEQRKVIVQVNYLRRADPTTRKLFTDITNAIGNVQAAFGVYCRGLLNNGSHIIDLARIALGEVASAQAFGRVQHYSLDVDEDIPFALEFCSGRAFSLHATIECRILPRERTRTLGTARKTCLPK